MESTIDQVRAAVSIPCLCLICALSPCEGHFLTMNYSAVRAEGSHFIYHSTDRFAKLFRWGTICGAVAGVGCTCILEVESAAHAHLAHLVCLWAMKLKFRSNNRLNTPPSCPTSCLAPLQLPRWPYRRTKIMKTTYLALSRALFCTPVRGCTACAHRVGVWCNGARLRDREGCLATAAADLRTGAGNSRRDTKFPARHPLSYHIR
jgi:hypothetical protein